MNEGTACNSSEILVDWKLSPIFLELSFIPVIILIVQTWRRSPQISNGAPLFSKHPVYFLLVWTALYNV